MSEIKVNKISPKQTCTTVTLGDSGDTFVIPSGVTITNNGTQTGFGRTGTVDWDTTAKTTNFTAVSGNGYFVNTTSGAITVTMPATPSAGDIVSLADYAGTWGTNNVTLSSANYNGSTGAPALSTNNQTITLIYVDGTQGWITTDGTSTRVTGFVGITATGGTITTCGDYKIHTFTGPGTFCVSSLSPCAPANVVNYLVVAGGGGGGSEYGGGGGGAGGLRFYGSPDITGYPGSPLNACAGITVTATAYPITVGGGGAGGTGSPSPVSPTNQGNNGSNSIFSTITSTGGGGGAGAGAGSSCCATIFTGKNGGSGGGGNGNASPGGPYPGGTGNTPPVSPSQGNNGGSGIHISGFFVNGGGGGGAMAAGQNTPPTSYPPDYGPNASIGGVGAGFPSALFGANGQPSGGYQYFSGGGQSGTRYGSPNNTYVPSPIYQVGALGGGGYGGYHTTPATTASPGTTNTGGGGGGGGSCASPSAGGDGGSGIVVIRYKYQ